MASRRGVQLVTVRDFTGGINLSRNVMQLQVNESPDLMNVDVSERGGFRLRKGVDRYGAALSVDINSIHGFYGSSGTQQVIVGDGTNLRYGAGGSWTTLAARTGLNRSVQFKNAMYFQNGTTAPLKWDGASSSSLTQTWNGDLTNPNNGDMPIAKCIAVYKGCVVIGNTLESGTAYPSRIRWSHPNFPEDWDDLHYIDVDTGADGDEITALAAFDDRLLIFKRNSVHVLFGDPPESFGVFPVSTAVGAISQEAVAVSDGGVYFFDWPSGVFRFNGKTVDWVFERLYPAIKDGTIPASSVDQVQLGWGNRRLWLSVPWEGSASRARTFVLSPQLGKQGSWTQYDLAVGPFLQWRPAQQLQPLLLAGGVGRKNILKLDQNRSTDRFDGTTETQIRSWYMTPWFDLGEPAVRKKWKRPEAVLIDGQDSEILVQVFKDYDPSMPARSLRFATTASADSTGTLVWDTGQWDVGKWAAPGDERWRLDRTSPVGSGRAVALKFNGPPTAVDWGVNALTLKVIPKPVRS